MNDIDTLLRDRLEAAAMFEVQTDPRVVHRGIARRQRRIRRRRGAVVLGALAVLGVGTGVVVAVGRDPGRDVTVQATAAPDGSDAPTKAGPPRFRAAPDWEVAHRETTTVAANIPLGPDSRAGNVPWDTVERLGDGQVVLFVMAVPEGESAAVDATFPPGRLPISLDDAQPGGLEGQPDDVYAERLGTRVNGWNLDVIVFYGGTGPSAEVRAAAQEQLTRLDVPTGPDR